MYGITIGRYRVFAGTWHERALNGNCHPDTWHAMARAHPVKATGLRLLLHPASHTLSRIYQTDMKTSARPGHYFAGIMGLRDRLTGVPDKPTRSNKGNDGVCT
jgi:hypothetical protein